MTVMKANTTPVVLLASRPATISFRLTISEPLSVITLPDAEQSIQRVVGGYDKSSKVGEELASDVEEDEGTMDSQSNGTESAGPTYK